MCKYMPVIIAFRSGEILTQDPDGRRFSGSTDSRQKSGVIHVSAKPANHK